MTKLILNSFYCCDNIDKIKKIIDYHIRWSLLHTLAAKHKSSIKKIMNNIYPNIQIENKDKVIQFFTKDYIKKIKKIFLISDSIPYFFDINWEDKSLNLYDMIKKEDSIYIKPIKCRYNNYNINKNCNNNNSLIIKRFFSTSTT